MSLLLRLQPQQGPSAPRLLELAADACGALTVQWEAAPDHLTLMCPWEVSWGGRVQGSGACSCQLVRTAGHALHQELSLQSAACTAMLHHALQAVSIAGTSPCGALRSLTSLRLPRAQSALQSLWHSSRWAQRTGAAA